MISLYHSVHQTSMPAAVEVRQDDTDFLKHLWRSGTLDFLDIRSSSFRLHRASLGQDLICREKTIMITHPEPRKCGVSHNQKTHWNVVYAPILNVSILRSDHPKTDITVQKKMFFRSVRHGKCVAAVLWACELFVFDEWLKCVKGLNGYSCANEDVSEFLSQPHTHIIRSQGLYEWKLISSFPSFVKAGNISNSVQLCCVCVGWSVFRLCVR